MKQWLETREVLDFLRAGKRAALATVVRVRGSAYRHEGAKLAVAEDGGTVGNVSGGGVARGGREGGPGGGWAGRAQRPIATRERSSLARKTAVRSGTSAAGASSGTCARWRWR